MKMVHLFSYPLIKFSDVALQQQQHPLGLDEHLSDVHCGCRVVHPGEDNYLFEKGRGNRDVSDHVDVCVQEHSCVEFIRQRICQEAIKHIIVLHVPGQSVHIGGRMCPCIFQRYLPVVGEQVPHGAIIDQHGDESMPVEMPRAQSRTLTRKTARLSASPSNFASRGVMALLYSLVAVAPVLGSSKFRTACE